MTPSPTIPVDGQTTFVSPDDLATYAASFVQTYAQDKVGLTALRDHVIARDLIAAMQTAGILHPGGYITGHRAHGTLVEDGHAVQRVAPGDPGYDTAQYFTRQSIDAPWVPENTPEAHR